MKLKKKEATIQLIHFVLFAYKLKQIKMYLKKENILKIETSILCQYFELSKLELYVQ